MTTSPPDREVRISADEARLGFSRVLREVREGATYLVTEHGRPVARVTPYAAPRVDREAAKAALFEHLRNQPAMNVEITWTRDDLYDL